MGSSFCDCLRTNHEMATYNTDKRRLRLTLKALRVTTMEEIKEFQPEMMINAVTVKYTIEAFNQVLPYLPATCIISDIASVKTGLPEFYATSGHPFVSSHPMFGPTFASLSNLSNENAIIITESDHLGKVFFRDLYNQLHLHVCEYSFEEHDETISYSLSIPFASTLVCARVMRHQDAPGTTFKRHMAIAHGLMSEDDYLLQEILFNPHTTHQLDQIKAQLDRLQTIIATKDAAAMATYLNEVRSNLK